MRTTLSRFALLTALVAPASLARSQQAPSRTASAATSPFEARIRRDEWGVPHVLARSDADAAYGLAFAHAEDDYATIQETLLASRGRLASLNGEAGVPSDYLFQLLDMPSTLKRYDTDLPANVRHILDGYAAGLNRYAALHPEKVAAGVLPFTGLDIAALGAFRGPTFYGLDGVVNQLATGVLPEDRGTGSNAVAVAPSRSADGHTRLLFNAHQPYVGPFSWWEAVVESGEGWHVAGGFFPGTPFLLGGHNAHLGWAATTNRPDLVDVYRLTIDPANPDRYKLDGRWLTLEKRTVSIDVRQPDGTMRPVQRQVLASRHGPVLRNKLGTFAFRYPEWGGMRQQLQYYRMNKARTMTEWQSAMRLRALPNINYLYADERGNIGFVANGLYPKRKEGFDWAGVVPGDRSDLIWTKLRPWSEVPQIWRPRTGWVYNANNTPLSATDPAGDLDPARFPKSMGLQTDMTNRAYRALETWGADRAITAEAFNRYKYDGGYSRRSDVEEIVTAITGADASRDPDLRQAQRIVAGWDHQSDVDNRGTALVALTWLSMRRSHGTALAGVQEAIKLLKAKFGRLDPRWGEVNRLRRGNVDLPLDGGPDALRAIYGRPDPDGRLRAFNGDGYTMFMDWDAAGRLTSRSIHQFGAATLDPRSPHYADQSPLFARHETKPVLFTEEQLAGHVSRDYRVGAAQRP